MKLKSEIMTLPRSVRPEKKHRHIKRIITALLLLTAATASYIFHPDWAGKLCSHFHPPQSISDRVTRILTSTPLIDGHNDLAILIRAIYKNHIYSPSFTTPFTKGGMYLHVDLPRLRAGLNGGAFWSVFWPCPPNGTDFSDQVYSDTVQATYQQIDVVNRLKSAYPTDFATTGDSREAIEAFKAGKLISPLGIEGLHQIGNSVANLRAYYDLGVRYATLTHNCGNRYADAALWEAPLRKAPRCWGGVSPEGRRLVAEMNRIGMIVDLSHTSVDTQIDVLGAGESGWEGSKAPVIFSHSSAYALCPHPRNVEDRVLRLVKERNGLVMVNFAPDFVSCKSSGREDGLPDFVKENSTLAHVVDHIMYIGDLIGYEHVGLGSDFDGILTTPEGLDDVSKFPDLVAGLLERGLSDEDAAKVVGGNILRVWRDVEHIGWELQKEGEPVLEDDVPGLKSEL